VAASGCHLFYSHSYRLYSIPDLFLWAKSKNIPLYGTTLVGPAHYSCQILPESEKKKVYLYYKSFIEKHKKDLTDVDIKHILDWLRFIKGSPDNREELEINFKKITSILDKSRSESFKEAVPQLADWYDSIKVS
jgi:hypothetical protein